MSASGQPSIAGTQAPWSSPRCGSCAAPVSLATRSASSGAPGAIVAQAVERFGEAVEIVDGLGLARRSTRPARRCPNGPRRRRSPWAAAAAGRAMPGRRAPARSSRISMGEPCETKDRWHRHRFIPRTAAWQPVCNRGRRIGEDDIMHAFTDGIARFVACLALLWAIPAGAQTLRMVAHSDLKVLDPIWTTAFITRNHGYMVYDVLFAKDDELKIQPQMVDKYEVSADKLTWTFTLRDGLEWHDGQPVTAEDCVASIKRWARARRARPAADGRDRRAEGGRRQDLHHRAQGAVRPGPRGAGQALLERALHDAQAGGRDRSQQADRRLHRLRPLHLQEGRMEARREGRLRQEPQVQAARRAALDAGRRQGGQDRPGRMDRHHRSADRGQCADRRARST